MSILVLDKNSTPKMGSSALTKVRDLQIPTTISKHAFPGMRSLAKCILADKSTLPLSFEAMLFLKVNANYWNEQTVQLATSCAGSQRVQQALNDDEKHIALES